MCRIIDAADELLDAPSRRVLACGSSRSAPLPARQPQRARSAASKSPTSSRSSIARRPASSARPSARVVLDAQQVEQQQVESPQGAGRHSPEPGAIRSGGSSLTRSTSIAWCARPTARVRRTSGHERLVGVRRQQFLDRSPTVDSKSPVWPSGDAAASSCASPSR